MLFKFLLLSLAIIINAEIQIDPLSESACEILDTWSQNGYSERSANSQVVYYYYLTFDYFGFYYYYLTFDYFGFYYYYLTFDYFGFYYYYLTYHVEYHTYCLVFFYYLVFY
ncbi:hypothetical protein N7523_010255 [Penicillium sp. IBT 18751x]|nr:hypothetical protein N7523_010255 [Penicillium sp. IBT 18751x]